MPTVLARAAAVSRDDRIVTEWDNPYLGFRVHVSLGGEIETTFSSEPVSRDPFDDIDPVVNGIETTFTFDAMSRDAVVGMERLQDTLSMCKLMLNGNPLGVLLSSDTPGWDSEVKSEVIDALFEPWIQLYLVASPEADAAISTEQ